MPKLSLHYFDFDGGRGEPIRIALHRAGIPFEDVRIPTANWPAHKERAPLGQLPWMEIDGARVTQSNALIRYVGRLTGLYPVDPLQALFCDEAMAVVEDSMIPIVATFGMQGEALREAREALSSGPIPRYLGRLETMLRERGGRWFAADAFTVADLKVFLWVRYLRSGMLDHVPADLVDRHAPLLVGHCDRVAADHGVIGWYAFRREAAQALND